MRLDAGELTMEKSPWRLAAAMSCAGGHVETATDFPRKITTVSLSFV